MLSSGCENPSQRWGESNAVKRKWKRQWWVEGSLGERKESGVTYLIFGIRFERGRRRKSLVGI